MSSPIPTSLRDRLTIGLGHTPESIPGPGGGTINEGAAIRAGANTYFVKWNDEAPPGLFEAESHGLNTLRDTGLLQVPEPFTWDEADGDCPAFLVMEHIATPAFTPNRDAFGEKLGRQLAMLHQLSAGTGGFGFDRDNFIGILPQANPSEQSWVTFYRDHRLAPQLAEAKSQRSLRARQIDKLERLMERLPDLIPDDNTPSLLHGDLWSGNYMMGPNGDPVLIDPAVYWGHREAELAFTELFGGFPDTMYRAYNLAHPLDSGYAERRLLYQIYPLLVHVNLFGGAYVREFEEAINPYL